jgi:hypothetical protein
MILIAITDSASTGLHNDPATRLADERELVKTLHFSGGPQRGWTVEPFERVFSR